MAPWLLKGFSGERPRVNPLLLPTSGAQSAVNVRLDDGALTPFREASHISSFAGSPTYKSIYRHQDTWYGWDGKVNAVPGPVASDRLYITGDGVPKMLVDGTTYDLAVPFPATKLTSATSGTGSGTVISRVYVYTYVTAFGEESEPCPASDAVAWQPGQTVTLGGFAAAPAGRNITKQRIYRTQTGDSGTDLYFIAERNASASDYTDSVADDAFGEVLPSRSYNAPPDGLAGLVSMPNGMMAAFDANNPRNLYFCEPYLPHAWPEQYELNIDFDIVALGAVGTSLIILTNGNPYLAQGTDPSSMQMVKIEANYPCINARGVQDLGFGIAYPSQDGLILTDSAGAARLVTAEVFGPAEWRELNPATMCAGQIAGRYVASYNSVAADGTPLVGTIIIPPSADSSFLIRSDVQAEAFYYDIGAGALYYLTASAEVKEFDPRSGNRLEFYWHSRPLLLSAAANYGAIRVDTLDELSAQIVANIEAARQAAITANTALLDSPLGSEINGGYINEYAFAGDSLQILPPSAPSLTVGVYADGRRVATITEANKEKRLPSGFRARKWEIDVFGSARISQITLARTVSELRTMGPS